MTGVVVGMILGKFVGKEVGSKSAITSTDSVTQFNSCEMVIYIF